VDSRSTEQGQAVRRRRLCERCERRFTTYERIEEIVPVAVQRSRQGTHQRIAAVGVAGGRRRRGVDPTLWARAVDVAFPPDPAAEIPYPPEQDEETAGRRVAEEPPTPLS